MEMKVYAIYDVKAGAYYPPFFKATDGLSIRDFTDMANDPNTMIGRHPEDYVLYQVGLWDDNKGELSPIKHVLLGKAVEYLAREKQETLPGFVNGDAIRGGVDAIMNRKAADDA